MKRIFLLLCIALVAGAACTPKEKIENGYKKTEVMIEMRDGVKLFTAIYSPVDCSEPRPIIMRRTPYSSRPYGKDFRSDDLFEDEMHSFTEHKYIVVYQDVRGRYESEGIYHHIRPLGTEVNDATDTYDTIEWLVGNVPGNNGCVGMCGISYPGYYSTIGALCGHPALKACSPQAPIGDWFIGDDMHHNGAYMLLDTDDFGSYVFRSREAFAEKPYDVNVNYGDDKYEYYRNLLTTKNIIGAYGDEQTLKTYYPFWYEIVNHPNYDEFWESVAHLPYVKDVKPAMLVVGALFDAEDCYGAVETYKKLLKDSPDNETYYLNGPWIHGSWLYQSYDHLGAWQFGPGLFDFFYEKVEYPFFAHYLEGAPEAPAKVTLVPSFATTDSTAAAFQTLYLDKMPDYKMVKMPFKAEGRSESTYTSDPLNPLRYLHPSKKDVRDRSYMADNYVDDSTAFINFDYKAVSDTLFLCGPIDVNLYYKTSGEDLDFIVKVLDVTPEGEEMMIRGDVFRARYAKSYAHPEFLTPGKVETLNFQLCDVVHYVLPGHSIRVQIQSTWFPLVDVNPQTAVENIYKADLSDYKAADVTVLHSAQYPSSISLPVATR